MMKVILDDELWITQGVMHYPTVINLQGKGQPGAVTPAPIVLARGTVLEIRRFVDGCAGCIKLAAALPTDGPIDVDHTHGRP